MLSPLFEQCFKVFIVEPLSLRNVLLVPSPSTGFIATEQQQGESTRIKHIQNPIRPARVLDTQLPEIAMPRAFDIAAVGITQART
ncbi:hypothetical protein TU84_02200 [Pseudomonas helleri]|nr:hypothetical protein TU84_02200 [Pseudomonas helleri]